MYDITMESGSNTATVKKENVLDRLNKRHKDRQNNTDVKLEQRNKENLQFEGVDYFSKIFTERLQKIEERLNNINNIEDINNLTCVFAEIMQEIQELQRYITASTMFLTEFKIKACQNRLNDVQNRCEELRVQYIPKKKFGFSGKKVTPKVTLNPKLSQDLLDAGSAGDAHKRTSFNWTLANRKNAYILLSGEEVNGQDITISEVNDCFIELKGHPGSVQISHANNCIIVSGPIARSLFAEYCSDCTLAVACQQLRLHSSTTCRLYIQVTCRAIIEDCNGIELSDYAYNYAGIEGDFELAGLDRTLNNYKDVADFNWLSPDVASPNWKIILNADIPNWQELRKNYEKQSISTL